MPALLIQIVTGFMLVHHMLPDMQQWLNFKNPIVHVLAAKIILLLLTAALAIGAQLRVLPKLSEKNLSDMAWHIIAVTIMSVLFVVVGVSVRTGWLY